jgi:hypothetical protein
MRALGAQPKTEVDLGLSADLFSLCRKLGIELNFVVCLLEKEMVLDVPHALNIGSLPLKLQCGIEVLAILIELKLKEGQMLLFLCLMGL